MTTPSASIDVCGLVQQGKDFAEAAAAPSILDGPEGRKYLLDPWRKTVSLIDPKFDRKGRAFDTTRLGDLAAWAALQKPGVLTVAAGETTAVTPAFPRLEEPVDVCRSVWTHPALVRLTGDPMLHADFVSWLDLAEPFSDPAPAEQLRKALAQLTAEDKVTTTIKVEGAVTTFERSKGETVLGKTTVPGKLRLTVPVGDCQGPATPVDIGLRVTSDPKAGFLWRVQVLDAGAFNQAMRDYATTTFAALLAAGWVALFKDR